MRCSLRLKLKEYKRFTILLFLQFFSIILFSQVKISGKVTGVDGQGIPLVSVQIRNTSFGTTTDNSGNFELDASLNPGNYTIEFSGIGFKTSQQTITVGNEKSYTAKRKDTCAPGVFSLHNTVASISTRSHPRRMRSRAGVRSDRNRDLFCSGRYRCHS